MNRPHYKVVVSPKYESVQPSTWNFHFDFAARMMFDDKVKTKLYNVDLFQGETLIASNNKQVYPLPL
jgi:hypothetical protein